MKRIIGFIFVSAFIHFSFCQKTANNELIKKEIYQAEKAFEKMASDKGITEAFYFYADENAVIHRENDTIIKGKENIKIYYAKTNKNATVNWTPDFIGVSDDGTLGYTYGKFVWKMKKDDGSTAEYKGVFHTVWKRQADNTWKYVWD